MFTDPAYHGSVFDLDLLLEANKGLIEPKPPTPPKCTCDIMALMAKGCQCGQMERERRLKADPNRG